MAGPAWAADRREITSGDEGARDAVEQVSGDIGMEAAYGGPLERAAAAEAFTEIFISVYQESGAPIFYRFATPQKLLNLELLKLVHLRQASGRHR